MSKHTELPWHIEDTNGARLSKVIVADKLGSNGSTVVVGQIAGPDKDANADFILAACSSFRRMRSALEKISCSSQTEGLLWWQEEARAALSDTPPNQSNVDAGGYRKGVKDAVTFLHEQAALSKSSTIKTVLDSMANAIGNKFKPIPSTGTRALGPNTERVER